MGRGLCAWVKPRLAQVQATLGEAGGDSDEPRGLRNVLQHAQRLRFVEHLTTDPEH